MVEDLARPGPPRSPLDTARAWLTWFGPGRLLAAALATVVVVGGGVWLLRAPVPATEAVLPVATSTTSSSAAATGGSTPAGVVARDPPTSTDGDTASSLLVHVAGAVRAPGVVEVPAPARVTDAVVAAGGPADDADLDAVNLAAPLADGQRVYVPRLGEVEPGTAVAPSPVPVGTTPSAGPTGPIDLNRATVGDLDALPGVGPATAAAIVTHREQHGPYATVDDLLDVRGIGPAKLAALRDLVAV